MKKTLLAFLLAMGIAGFGFSLEADEVRELLAPEKGGEIEFLSRINLGIPGGENWIAVRTRVEVIEGRRSSSSLTYIYTIGVNREVRFIGVMQAVKASEMGSYDWWTDTYAPFEYDVSSGIPGTQIGNTLVWFGDFNGDGMDEIAAVGGSTDGERFEFDVKGYDGSNAAMVSLMRVNFTPNPRVPPIIFTRYQGTYGIAVYVIWGESRRTWVFRAWNEENHEFEETGEINENDIDFSAGPVVRPRDAQADIAATQFPENPDLTDQENWKTENMDSVNPEIENREAANLERENVETENPDLANTENKKSRFPVLTFAITGGVILVAGIVTIAVLAKRRKGKAAK